MTSWTGLTAAYAVLAGIGFAIGRHVAAASAGVPPLGSAFDRALLPGAFDELIAS